MGPVESDPVASDGDRLGKLGISGRSWSLSRSPPRRILWALLVLLTVLLVWDLSRRPEQQWSAALLLAAIDLYQSTLSPEMETAGVRCRFEPTCSHYAEAAIRSDGALVGSWRSAVRVARCGPWTPAGTSDQP